MVVFLRDSVDDDTRPRKGIPKDKHIPGHCQPSREGVVEINVEGHGKGEVNRHAMRARDSLSGLGFAQNRLCTAFSGDIGP